MYDTHTSRLLFSIALTGLMFLNLNRCNFSDSGCEKFSGECYMTSSKLKMRVLLCVNLFSSLLVDDFVSPSFADLINLKILNLGMNNITNSCLVHLRGCLTFLLCSYLHTLILFSSLCTISPCLRNAC